MNYAKLRSAINCYIFKRTNTRYYNDKMLSVFFENRKLLYIYMGQRVIINIFCSCTCRFDFVLYSSIKFYYVVKELFFFLADYMYNISFLYYII